MIPVNIAVRDKTVFLCRLDTLCLLRCHFCEVGGPRLYQLLDELIGKVFIFFRQHIHHAGSVDSHIRHKYRLQAVSESILGLLL